MTVFAVVEFFSFAPFISNIEMNFNSVLVTFPGGANTATRSFLFGDDESLFGGTKVLHSLFLSFPGIHSLMVAVNIYSFSNRSI